MKTLRFPLAFILLLCVASCATFSGLNTTEKLVLVGDYFANFIKGVELAIPYLKSFSPTFSNTIDSILIPLVEKTKIVLELYRNALSLYKAGSVSLEEVLSKRDEIYNLIQAINQIVGHIKQI